jgi:hypothetical protein
MKQRGIISLFILIVCISGLLMLGRLTRGHDWGGDFSAYIMQARSITEASPRAFVESNRFTIEESSMLIGPTVYPWGFPMLLAPLYALFGLNILALKAVGVFSYLIFLIVLWFGFRRDHTSSGFLCLVCLFAFNPAFIEFSNRIMSDLPFLAVSTICVLLIKEIVVKERCIISRRSDLILLGAGIAFAYAIRTIGLLLFLTLGFSQVVAYLRSRSLSDQQHPFRNSIKQMITPYLIFFFFVTIWKLFLPDGGGGYSSQLNNISLVTLKENLFSYLLYTPSKFFSDIPYGFQFYLFSIPLSIAGAARRYRTDYPAIIYTVLTLFIIIVWPWEGFIRLLFPIFPFYISFFISGLEFFAGGTTVEKRGIRKMIAFIPVLIVVLLFLYVNVHAVYGNYSKDVEITDGPFAPTSQEMFSFIAKHTEPDDIITFFKPRVMRLMTDRQSIRINRAKQLSRGDYLCLYLRKTDTKYQVSDRKVDRLLAQGAARIVYKNDDFKVYRMIKARENIYQ